MTETDSPLMQSQEPIWLAKFKDIATTIVVDEVQHTRIRRSTAITFSPCIRCAHSVIAYDKVKSEITLVSLDRITKRIACLFLWNACHECRKQLIQDHIVTEGMLQYTPW